MQRSKHYICAGNIVTTKLIGSKKAVQRYKIQYKIGIFLPIKNTKVSFKYIKSRRIVPQITAIPHLATLSLEATNHTATNG